MITAVEANKKTEEKIPLIDKERFDNILERCFVDINDAINSGKYNCILTITKMTKNIIVQNIIDKLSELGYVVLFDSTKKIDDGMFLICDYNIEIKWDDNSLDILRRIKTGMLF